MTRYFITAWCDRPFFAQCEVEADSPEEALAKARETIHDAPAEDCDSDYPWDEWRVDTDDEDEILLHLDAPARLRNASATLLDACRKVVERWEHGDLAEAARACREAIIAATSDPQQESLATSLKEESATDQDHTHDDPASTPLLVPETPPSGKESVMTRSYHVHLYREMRLTFSALAANSPQEAAVIARDLPTDQADEIEDCDGKTLAALVDLDGDDGYAHSETIDLEDEREPKSAELLAALEDLLAEIDGLADEFAICDEIALGECGRAARKLVREVKGDQGDELTRRALTGRPTV